MVLLASAVAVPSASGLAPRGSWLDAPLVNWNRPGRDVPPPPARPGDRADTPRCAHQVRPPAGAEDRALLDAGWTPLGALTVMGELTLVRAASGVDGMCRPLGYQVFAFVGGRLAGTLSPVPMDSRRDGAATDLRVDAQERLRATFTRYAKEDPLCCPRRLDVVAYRVERGPAGALIVPVEVVRGATP